MQQYFADFFTQYCRFISKDLLATFDKRLGRNTKVINTFYKVFFIITKKDVDNSHKDQAIRALTEQIDSYMTDGDTSIYAEMYDALGCTNKQHINGISYFGHLFRPLNDFNEAVSDYNKLYENHIFKQGLIEFNNALSHLFAGFFASETNFEKNVKKACTHLHRGSLDYYKTIIKDKESLTHQQKQELIKIRDLEIQSIGLEVNNTNKDEILIAYRDLARDLHKIQ